MNAYTAACGSLLLVASWLVWLVVENRVWSDNEIISLRNGVILHEKVRFGFRRREEIWKPSVPVDIGDAGTIEYRVANYGSLEHFGTPGGKVGLLRQIDNVMVNRNFDPRRRREVIVKALGALRRRDEDALMALRAEVLSEADGSGYQTEWK